MPKCGEPWRNRYVHIHVRLFQKHTKIGQILLIQISKQHCFAFEIVFTFGLLDFFALETVRFLKNIQKFNLLSAKLRFFLIFCHLFFVKQRTIILGCILLIDRSLPGLFDTIFCRKCYIQREQLINIYELQCSIQGFYCQFHARFGASSTKTYILQKKVDFCDKSKFFYRAKNTMAGGQMSGLVV